MCLTSWLMSLRAWSMPWLWRASPSRRRTRRGGPPWLRRWPWAHNRSTMEAPGRVRHAPPLGWTVVRPAPPVMDAFRRADASRLHSLRVDMHLFLHNRHDGLVTLSPRADVVLSLRARSCAWSPTSRCRPHEWAEQEQHRGYWVTVAPCTALRVSAGMTPWPAFSLSACLPIGQTRNPWTKAVSTMPFTTVVIVATCTSRSVSFSRLLKSRQHGFKEGVFESAWRPVPTCSFLDFLPDPTVQPSWRPRHAACFLRHWMPRIVIGCLRWWWPHV